MCVYTRGGAHEINATTAPSMHMTSIAKTETAAFCVGLHPHSPIRQGNVSHQFINSCLKQHKFTHLLRSCHRAKAEMTRTPTHPLLMGASPPNCTNANLPAVTPQTQKQPSTSSENLSIFQTLGRRAVPFTPAGAVNWCAVVCSSAFASVRAYRRDRRTGNDDGSTSFNTLNNPDVPEPSRQQTGATTRWSAAPGTSCC